MLARFKREHKYSYYIFGHFVLDCKYYFIKSEKCRVFTDVNIYKKNLLEKPENSTGQPTFQIFLEQAGLLIF